MKCERDDLRDGLLSRMQPPQPRMASYEKEVRAMIEEKEKRLAREKTLSRWMWLFVVALSTTFLVLGGVRGGELRLWFGIQACFWFLFGAVFLLRYFLNRNQLEFLREFKNLELKVLELQEKLHEKA